MERFKPSPAASLAAPGNEKNRRVDHVRCVSLAPLTPASTIVDLILVAAVASHSSNGMFGVSMRSIVHMYPAMDPRLIIDGNFDPAEAADGVGG